MLYVPVFWTAICELFCIVTPFEIAVLFNSIDADTPALPESVFVLKNSPALNEEDIKVAVVACPICPVAEFHVTNEVPI
jgi:hypothetical protein